MKASDHIAARDLRDRAASLATTAAAHLREIAIFAAPLDSMSFAQMQGGEQTILAANQRLADTRAVMADLASVLAELSHLLAGPSATPDRKGVNP